LISHHRSDKGYYSRVNSIMQLFSLKNFNAISRVICVLLTRPRIRFLGIWKLDLSRDAP
jgi:hypothetical protein